MVQPAESPTLYTAAIETFKPANMATNNRATALHPTPKSMAKRERANREKKKNSSDEQKSSARNANDDDE
ncbi:hypothetical protein HYC85_030531 [Camellia sinensis]|uniref:Uncharacterized protein n=1 Tax=Camellia sinensis TaxID=4442 RepID=A0A7J7G0Y6_CAMSI|nr:hypothetical protein HYC85_030531 [Camellia sinensis]